MPTFGSKKVILLARLEAQDKEYKINGVSEKAVQAFPNQ